jgi:hypothetical protein
VQNKCSGRVNPAIFLVALLLLLGSSAAWMAFGKRGGNLPLNASVLNEGFGAPLSLGVPESQARKANLAKKAAIDLVFLTPEALANHNLYKEHPGDRDLIAVIAADTGNGAHVQGLRAYLGKLEAEGERATLNGQFAANLSLDEVKQIYGKPFSETPEQNGRTHLVYYFGDPQDPRLAYRLTTSHDYTGKIFSMALERVLAPQ